MTTQLLEGPQTGAGERHGLYGEATTRGKLRTALDEYESAVVELEELRGKVVRAQADADMIGDNHSLSEAESLRAMSDSQGRKALYTGRIAAFERKVAGLLSALKSELVDAMRTQTNTLRGLIEKERESIVSRIYAALGVANNAGGRGEIVALTRFAPSIRELEMLLPRSFYEVPKLSADAVVATAKTVLANAELLKDEEI